MALITLALGLMGCTFEREQLSQSWQIDRTRILGVLADVVDENGDSTGRAEASPGETVLLSSLTVHPTRNIAGVFWMGCVLASADEYGCETDPEAIQALFEEDLESLSIEEQLALYEQAQAAGFLGFEPYPDPFLQPKIQVPVDLLDELEPEEQLEGLSYILNLLATPENASGNPDDSDTEIATKRVVVSQAVDNLPWTPNHNPHIQYLLIDGDQHNPGELQSASPEDIFEIEPILTTDSVEEYSYVSRSGEEELRQEEPWFAFYSTDGFFDIPYSLSDHPEVTFSIPKSTALETIEVWIVVRDRRGGMHWQQQTFKIQ
jgi:hypothetical protein